MGLIEGLVATLWVELIGNLVVGYIGGDVDLVVEVVALFRPRLIRNLVVVGRLCC